MQEHSVGTILTDATEVTVYKVPTGYYAKWYMAHILNADAATKTITLSWYDSSTTTKFLIYDTLSVASKVRVESVESFKIMLDEGDEIKAQGVVASNFHMINTFELIRK